MTLRRPWLLPLVPVYGAAAGLKNFLFDRGWMRVRRLDRPVLSVGSLSAGGAGKTPTVIMLAELLGRQGIAVDILTRGYGRGSGVVEEVDAGGDPRRFGDEPLEMARAGLQVFVGAERFEAGLASERIGMAAVHLLDDGFQHRRLARALDIVLLTGEDAEDWLLPAGNLREPLRSLRRADVVVIREEEVAEFVGTVAAWPTTKVWIVRRRLEIPSNRPARPILFCGIARPKGFLRMVKASGCDVAGTVIFPDHHAFSPKDIERLAEAARHVEADGFVTTGKDAVKISEKELRMLTGVGPVWVARLRLDLLDEESALETLLGVLRSA